MAYERFNGTIANEGSIGVNPYFSSHASYEPLTLESATTLFQNRYLGRVVGSIEGALYKRKITDLTNTSRAYERILKGIEPLVRSRLTEISARKQLPTAENETYQLRSLDKRVVDLSDPNTEPRSRVELLSDSIYAQDELQGKYDVKAAKNRFKALYIADVVARMSQDRYLRTLTEAKQRAARYLGVSERTIQRHLKDAEQLGYISIIRKGAYEQIQFNEQARINSQDDSIEKRLAA